jgi:hypothetical protein
MSLESGPFLTMVTLGIAGLSAFPWQALVGAILPLALGMALGNLDPAMRRFLAPAVPALVPFLGLTLGLTINLTAVWQAGLLGVGLGLFVVLIGGAVLLLADKLTRGHHGRQRRGGPDDRRAGQPGLRPGRAERHRAHRRVGRRDRDPVPDHHGAVGPEGPQAARRW